MSDNFTVYHELIEQKFSSLINEQNQALKYKEMVDKIQRESQQIHETQMVEFGKEIEKYKLDIDRLKDIEKEYQHLDIEHKHLKSKYEDLANDTKKPKTRSGSHIISVDSLSKSIDNSGKLKDEIQDLRQRVNKWEYKWEALRQTPAKYYIDDIDQKYRFSVDEWRHKKQWGMGQDNIDSQWRKR